MLEAPSTFVPRMRCSCLLAPSAIPRGCPGPDCVGTLATLALLRRSAAPMAAGEAGAGAVGAARGDLARLLVPPSEGLKAYDGDGDAKGEALAEATRSVLLCRKSRSAAGTVILAGAATGRLDLPRAGRGGAFRDTEHSVLAVRLARDLAGPCPRPGLPATARTSGLRAFRPARRRGGRPRRRAPPWPRPASRGRGPCGPTQGPARPPGAGRRCA